MRRQSKRSGKGRGSKKAISLKPLEFDEAVADLLKVKPVSKGQSTTESEITEKSKD